MTDETTQPPKDVEHANTPAPVPTTKAENSQHLDRMLENTFPASDPVPAKHIT